MSVEPRFYVIGTKYGGEDDVLPLMISHSVVSTGYEGTTDLSRLVGKTDESVAASISTLLPNATPVARGTLSRFVGLRPGDVIALKSHSSPLGKRARLEIVRYAVVRGTQNPHYRLLDDLHHSIEVDFLCEQEPIELPFGYGQTLYEITDTVRIKAIFGAYALAAKDSSAQIQELGDRATHTSRVAARGEYIITRAHNELQNSMRARLVTLFGESAVRQEENNIDLSVVLPGTFILFEVKASPSPVSCMREALGQMLHYAWRVAQTQPQIQYVVVGPNALSDSDAAFVKYVRETTMLPLTYCTPNSYVP